MKILHKGDLQKIKPTIKFKCLYCDCIFECEHGEYAMKSGGRNDDYYGAKCPTCNKEVWIER